MICADPELAQLDDRMGQVYQNKYAQLSEDDRHALAEDQRRWVESRNAQCNQTQVEAGKCISQLTRTRIATLEHAQTSAITISQPHPVQPIALPPKSQAGESTVAPQPSQVPREEQGFEPTHNKLAELTPNVKASEPTAVENKEIIGRIILWAGAIVFIAMIAPGIPEDLLRVGTLVLGFARSPLVQRNSYSRSSMNVAPEGSRIDLNDSLSEREEFKIRQALISAQWCQKVY